MHNAGPISILRLIVIANCIGVGAFGTQSPDVALLSCDTLRADYLGCYGQSWNLSPNLDQLAKTALLFEDAVCAMPLTAPSFAAMFASQYPRSIGMTRNGLRIPDGVPLVAEIFQQAGYHTFAVQSNWTLRSRLSGLNRGFDVYDEDFDQRRWGFYKGERSAEEVTRAALEQLNNRPKDKPLFAWIHYSDPHAPYHYHAEYSPVKQGLRALEQRERTRVKYASEVACMDDCLGRVLQALPDTCIIMFVADHGESLYEHGYLGHGRNVQHPCMRIPLLLRAPGLTPERTRRPVMGLDVGPTLLALAGIAPPADMLGRNMSLDDGFEERPRFMETYGGAVPRLPGVRQLMTHTSPLQQGVLLGEWKLIQAPGRPSALYHLPSDPMEKRNRHGEKEDIARALRRLLNQWDQGCSRKDAADAELTAEDMEALKSLGYAE